MWNNDYQEYINYKFNNIKAQTSLKSILMLLNDDDFISHIQINNKSSILNDVELQK